MCIKTYIKTCFYCVTHMSKRLTKELNSNDRKGDSMVRSAVSICRKWKFGFLDFLMFFSVIVLSLTVGGTAQAYTTSKIASGVAHSIALKSDGTVWTWCLASDGCHLSRSGLPIGDYITAIGCIQERQYAECIHKQAQLRDSKYPGRQLCGCPGTTTKRCAGQDGWLRKCRRSG